jgi:hypothetical protein
MSLRSQEPPEVFDALLSGISSEMRCLDWYRAHELFDPLTSGEGQKRSMTTQTISAPAEEKKEKGMQISKRI